MLFAHLKRILKLDRLRLRGPHGAKDEFLVAAPPNPTQDRQAHPGAGTRLTGAAPLALLATGNQAVLTSDFFDAIRPISAVPGPSLCPKPAVCSGAAEQFPRVFDRLPQTSAERFHRLVSTALSPPVDKGGQSAGPIRHLSGA